MKIVKEIIFILLIVVRLTIDIVFQTNVTFNNYIIYNTNIFYVQSDIDDVI